MERLATPQINRLQGQSLDIQADILQQLQAVVPSAFSDGKLDVERLKQLIGESAIAQGERYALSWAGKSEILDVMRQPTTGTLIPAPDESVNFDRTGHVFIEGENLEVLKILQKNYYGRVKMIYIDPPYNTGKDSFIYPDRFEETREEYMRRVNDIDDKDGTLTKAGFYRKNSKENGQFHSNWLNMMYPRLFLARNLLKDDGVIFVSIDDNEVGNLRLLMDEVFGEENFVANVIWHSKYTTSNDAKYVSRQHESVLIYAKSIESFEIGLLDRTEEMDAAYTNPDNDLRGVWKSTPLHAKSGSRNYTMTFSNGKTWTAPNGRYPRYSESKLLELYNDNRLYFGKDGNGVPNVKTFLTEVKQGKTVGSIWSYQEVGSSHQANEQLADILGKGAFDNPKPLGLIKQAIKVSNAQEGDIIFDFFSGSGTTGQAVLELNAEDGGDLKFVCVQLPILNGDAPNAQEAGFDHIADIAKERIRRVIKKLETEQNGALGFDKKLDLGMRVFKVAPSNFKIWRGDLMENEEELAEQMELFIDSLKDGAKEDNIAWELAIKSLDPMQLDVRMEKIELGGVPVYNFENGRLFIVLHDISQESINAILAAKPRALLVLDSLFGNQADMITNLVLDCERLNIQFQLV